MEKVGVIMREGMRVADEDPRRIIHAFKVGLALVLVSSFYYYQPFGPFTDYFGINAMWAVMTVVVVFEFSVGATLGKGLNRGVATLVAGGLGIGAHQVTRLSGRIVEPILLVLLVFVLAALATFVRFFPLVKKRFDYLLQIFILTFALISLSGFRDEELLDLTESRLSTVLIGGLSCVLISVFVCPVWAGQDLHSLIASNFDTLAHFLQDFGEEYMEKREDEGDYKVVEKRRKNHESYKRVLDSKSEEETLATFAEWEPPHGNFRFRHPWKQYIVVAALLRQCAYRIDVLNSYINSDLQIPNDLKEKLKTPIRRMSLESGKSLKEMSISIKKMIKSSSSDIHLFNSQSACKDLSTLLKSSILKDVEPLQMISLLTTVSTLIDIVNLTVKISESVHELAFAAKFKNKMRPTVLSEKSNSGIIGRAVPIKSEEANQNVVTVSNDHDVISDHVESSHKLCQHVVIKIVDNHSNGHEDGEIHDHANLLENVDGHDHFH